MSQAPRRIGMIGAGWVTQYHLPAWAAQSARATVVAIADPSAAAGSARAAEYAIAANYTDVRAMLAAERLDAVDICAPREAHAELVRLAADAGCAVLCQKPLAMDLGAARQLVADIGGRVPLMVHENWRFRPHYRTLRRWLDEGVAGELWQVQLEFLSSGMIADGQGNRPALVRQPFFRTLDRLLVMEVLIHHLDTLRFLLGEFTLQSARLERTNNDIVSEDVATVLLQRRADGTPLVVTGNLATHGAPPLPSERLRIFGKAGTLELDGNVITATGAATRRETFDAGRNYQESYNQVIVRFLDGLDGAVPFETSPDDNLKTLELVEAIYEQAGPVVVR